MHWKSMNRLLKILSVEGQRQWVTQIQLDFPYLGAVADRSRAEQRRD